MDAKSQTPASNDVASIQPQRKPPVEPSVASRELAAASGRAGEWAVRADTASPDGVPSRQALLDLRALVNYSWASEQRDEARSDGEREGHVYEALQRLDRYPDERAADGLREPRSATVSPGYTR